MPLMQGDKNIDKVYLGDTEVAKIMLGDSEIWSNGIAPGLYETEWVGASAIDTYSGVNLYEDRAIGLMDELYMYGDESANDNEINAFYEGYDFASLIPAEAVFRGIEYKSAEYSNDNQYVQVYTYYYLGSTPLNDGDYVARATSIRKPSYIDKGSSTTTYGMSMADIRDSEFKVRHRMVENAGYYSWDSQSDGIQLKIHYEIL